MPGEIERNDKEPVSGEQVKSAESGKTKRAYSSARRQLKPEELALPAVSCFLIDEIERLEGDVRELKDYKERFHEKDKEKSVLEEKSKKPLYADIIFGVCLGVGCGLIGLVPFFWDIEIIYGVLLGSLGLILVIGGMIAKAVIR